jgi:hypothetical protein
MSHAVHSRIAISPHGSARLEAVQEALGSVGDHERPVVLDVLFGGLLFARKRPSPAKPERVKGCHPPAILAAPKLVIAAPGADGVNGIARA